MEDFDEDPLDLFGDDGDGVNEMCLLFDEDEEKGVQGPTIKSNDNSGCCVLLFGISSLITVIGWGVFKVSI